MWTDTRIEMLTNLWADGLSAAQIADELACGVSRSAVLGKIHRLKLPGRKKENSVERERKPRAARRVHINRGLGSGQLQMIADGYVEPDILIEIPVEQRKTLLQLTEKTCRFPIGDPGSGDFYFCGGDAVIDLPYCAYHARISYRPPEDRRRPHTFRR